jgi:hypothetical protein
MILRNCLTPLLILLLFSPLIPLIYAGDGPNAPVLEHPWEEVKRPQSTITRNSDLTPFIKQVYLFSVPLLNSGVIIVVVKEKSQEVVNKDMSVKNVSLPRKK